jgi:hypothetical protein
VVTNVSKECPFKTLVTNSTLHSITIMNTTIKIFTSAGTSNLTDTQVYTVVNVEITEDREFKYENLASHKKNRHWNIYNGLKMFIINE